MQGCGTDKKKKKDDPRKAPRGTLDLESKTVSKKIKWRTKDII